ncbi:MAG: class I SAM-dependent methyltransferase [Bacillota bacterium]|nr:class I SAM-dependent methyltransferase [Bacillota bacterium]
MKKEITCSLCSSQASFFYQFRSLCYYRCSNCRSIMLDPGMYLPKEKEKSRYEEHNNDINDPGYQQFVMPVVKKVEQKFNQTHSGLDFGAGTGPVITKLLQEKGFNVQVYDPFFCNNPAVLSQTYNFIVCCEVIEHFHFPAREFELLRSLLKPGGSLYLMTEIYHDGIDLGKWYYKNDPTHVFFYHEHALDWIKKHFKFSALKREGRLIHFEV